MLTTHNMLLHQLHVHVEQSSNSLTNYYSTNSCDSGTVLLNVLVHCKFMTKVTHSSMLILVNVHDFLLPCAYMYNVFGHVSLCMYIMYVSNKTCQPVYCLPLENLLLRVFLTEFKCLQCGLLHLASLYRQRNSCFFSK